MGIYTDLVLVFGNFVNDDSTYKHILNIQDKKLAYLKNHIHSCEIFDDQDYQSFDFDKAKEYIQPRTCSYILNKQLPQIEQEVSSDDMNELPNNKGNWYLLRSSFYSGEPFLSSSYTLIKEL